MERRQFTREFKLEAVRLIKDRGVSYAQASAGLKVHATQLGQSVCGLSAARVSGPGSDEAERSRCSSARCRRDPSATDSNDRRAHMCSREEKEL